MLITICKTIIIIWCISCAYTLCMRLAKDRQVYRMMIANNTIKQSGETSDASESDNRDGSV